MCTDLFLAILNELGRCPLDTSSKMMRSFTRLSAARLLLESKDLCLLRSLGILSTENSAC